MDYLPNRPETPSSRKEPFFSDPTCRFYDFTWGVLYSVLSYIPAMTSLLGLYASMKNRGANNVKIIKSSWRVPQISVRVCSQTPWFYLIELLRLQIDISLIEALLLFDRLQDTLVQLWRSHRTRGLWDRPPPADAVSQSGLLPACGRWSYDSVRHPCARDRWCLSSVSLRYMKTMKSDNLHHSVCNGTLNETVIIFMLLRLNKVTSHVGFTVYNQRGCGFFSHFLLVHML